MNTLRLFSIVVIGMIALSACATPTPAGPIGGGMGMIVFAKLDGKSIQIYSMKVDGTDQKRISFTAGSNIFPKWSPDGKQIAYFNDVLGFGNNYNYWRVYLMNPDGTNAKMLVDIPSFDPHWSPDGKQLVFNSYRGAAVNTSDLHIANVDGTNIKNLLNSPATFDAGPRWSPDGKKILFYSDRNEPLAVDLNIFNVNRKIFTVNVDGTGLTQLTKETTDNYQPAWSPDGKKIAFVSSRDGNPEIYVMNADGTNPTRLTNDPKNDTSPVWSPNGTKILFASAPIYATNVYMMDADGSNVKQITNDPNAMAAFGLDWK
ncbi:MAG: hypothetical protein AABZ00_00630 [Chloroflexota bacterium]